MLSRGQAQLSRGQVQSDGPQSRIVGVQRRSNGCTCGMCEGAQTARAGARHCRAVTRRCNLCWEEQCGGVEQCAPYHSPCSSNGCCAVATRALCAAFHACSPRFACFYLKGNPILLSGTPSSPSTWNCSAIR
eukprot:3112191-Rhodomonas_salina.3